MNKPQDQCAAPECKEDATVKGYCRKHYQRIRRHGSTENMRGKGGGNPRWKLKSKLPDDIKDAYGF